MAPNEAREFGKYELVSKLAAGGMAVTYRARMKGAAGVTKPVVIKQILPHFADDPAFVEMFVSEARVAAALTHNNIAQVFDFGEIDGQFFLAMEFVHGQPLSKVLRKAQKAGMTGLPLPLALYIGTQICDGLDYAHRHVGEDGKPLGLVHRDVSPDNVLISYEGQVKVIDFGIAKATSMVEARTSPGTLKGKYPYFSTEQARGEQDLDARSDTYAVGVVLYEMLCGRRPYDGEFAIVLPRLLTGDYPAPSSLNPSIPPELEQVMFTAMALEREQRYPTAHAFSEALREQLHSNWPRFSPSLVTQLLGHLFAEDLAAEGRKIEVTPTFLEQLAAWQAPATSATPAMRTRAAPSTGSGRTNVRSSGSYRPASEGGRSSSSASLRAVGKPPSNGGGRTVTSSSGRRVTSSTGQARPQPPLPALDEPTMLAPEVTRAAPQETHDTPIELPAVSAAPPKQQKTPQQEMAEHLTREEQERAERRQRLVMLISVPMFGLALALFVIHYAVTYRNQVDEKPLANSLWLTSKPAGASVKLNGRDVPGVTPMVVPNVPVDEASTLVLTLAGYRPWTKRFTATNTALPPVDAELERIDPASAPPPAPPDTPPAPGTTTTTSTAPPSSTPAEKPAETAAAPGVITPGVPLDYNVVDYPTRLFVMRPRYNAFPVEKYPMSAIELSPGSTYSVNTEGSASLGPGRGGNTTVAYFAEGDGLSADDSFGLIGPASKTLKGVRRLSIFLLDDDRADNSGSIRVHLRQSQLVAPRQLTFDATQDAVVLQPQHQFVLRKLNPNALYLLTVRDDLAELHPGPGGQVHRVLCAESLQQSSRRNHRILEVGKRYQLTGADTLRCTFPDMRVEDNEGAVDVDIVDVTEMSRQERAAALKGSTR